MLDDFKLRPSELVNRIHTIEKKTHDTWIVNALRNV